MTKDRWVANLERWERLAMEDRAHAKMHQAIAREYEKSAKAMQQAADMAKKELRKLGS